jgi:hypothetical protein
MTIFDTRKKLLDTLHDYRPNLADLREFFRSGGRKRL